MLFPVSFRMVCRHMVLMGLWVLVSRITSIPLFVSRATALLREPIKAAMLGPMAMTLTHGSRRQLLRRLEQYWSPNTASAQCW